MGRPKGTTAVKSAPQTAPASLPDDLILLKTKLRRKYALLKDVYLDFPDRNGLLNQVCKVLGMTRTELDWVLKDL